MPNDDCNSASQSGCSFSSVAAAAAAVLLLSNGLRTS